MRSMTPDRVAQLFAICSTVRRAQKAKAWARSRGMPVLGTALFFREMELWAQAAYPAGEGYWRQRRQEALNRIDTRTP